MKRPEGFGARPEKTPAPSSRTSAKATRVTSAAPARERPARRETRAPSPTRAPGAESRAVQRTRKREERAVVRRFTRRSRRRRIGGIVAGGLVLSLVALVAAAVFSPILALRTVRVEGTVRLDPEALAAAVSGQLGTPLALLDENRIRSELSEFRLIRSYVTELVPPDTLVIHIVERAPIGVIAAAAGFDLVDPAGVVVESSPTRPAGVPLIVVSEQGVDGPGFASMAEVLLALPLDVVTQVDQITARTRDDVTLILAGGAQRVVWGSADASDRKAAVFALLLATYGGSGPGEYDVSAPGSAVFHPGAG